MFTLVILCTLYTPIYSVYPCIPLSYCIPCIPLYTLFTHVYPSHTVYLVYPYIPCLPQSYRIPCIPLYILFTHVYPSHTVYLVHPYISYLPMFILVILYTLCTPILYPVYPCLPQSYCMPWYGMVTLFIHGISFRYIYFQYRKTNYLTNLEYKIKTKAIM